MGAHERLDFVGEVGGRFAFLVEAHDALWLRRLMPLLLGPDGRELVRRANEHQTDRAGNPKRRPPNTRWVYG